MVKRRLPPRRKPVAHATDFDQQLVQLAQQERFAEAVAVCEVADTRRNLSPLAQHVYGVCLLHLDHADRAVEVLERAIDAQGQLSPGDGRRRSVSLQRNQSLRAMRNDLSKACFAAQRFDRSIEILTELVDQSPDEIALVRNLIMVLERAERIDEAIARCKSALDRWPDDARLAGQWGDLMMSRQDWNAAADSYLRSLDADPTDSDIYRRLVSVYRRLENPGQVANTLRHWLSNDPGNPVATHLLAAVESESDPQSVPARASTDYVREVFDQFADTFDDQLTGLGYAAPQQIASLLQRSELRRENQLRVLDAGCGTGMMGVHLRPFANNLQGVDLSPAMLARATDRGYDDLICADLMTYLSQHPCSYDLIVAADTLIYFGDLHDVFNATFHALAGDDAMFVFSLEKQADDANGLSMAENEQPQGRSIGYHLNASGRYSHQIHYVHQSLQSCGYCEIQVVEDLLRREAEHEITGLYWTARKRR